MTIGGVDFPQPLLNALRDGRLVVFAGAGVSMGPPAGLPSFRELAEEVAKGTGKSIAESEDIDKFLGRLKEDGVEVHQRAAGKLQPDNLEPNALHRNLLRLFQEKDDPVRIVTTNFDCLFEQAAEVEGLFKSKPRVFEAPAFPLGTLQDIVDQATISKPKHQGNEVESSTWPHLLSRDRINGHHLTMSTQRTEQEATR